jgi:hypothetical protein
MCSVAVLSTRKRTALILSNKATDTLLAKSLAGSRLGRSTARGAPGPTGAGRASSTKMRAILGVTRFAMERRPAASGRRGSGPFGL